MGKLVGGWIKKMTPDATKYAMERLACNIHSTDVVKELKDKFDITISDVRIRTIRDSKKWFPVFKAAQDKFLKSCSDDTTIAIAAKKHRLTEADSIAKKLGKLIDRIETAINVTEDGTTISEKNLKYITYLIKALNETSKIYRDFLRYAKDEVEQSNTRKSGDSFLTNINLNTEGKAKELPIDKQPKQVIDINEVK